MRPELSDDAVLGGRLRLLQPRTGHRFGHDAILLAAAVPANAGDRALELGSGVGAAGLALASRVAGLSVSLIEIDPILAELAQENARRNALTDRVSAHCLDATAPLRAFAAAGLVDASFDQILSNPPFNDPARHNASPDPARRGAHLGSGLRPWIASAAQLLRPQGTLTLIYRADGLAEVLDALAGDFGSIAIVPIFPKPNAGAIRVVVRGLKGSRGALTLCPGLLLNEQGRSTRAAESILREGAALSFAA
jgi:tRNA1(Val) A37 N6-methylase TrmN6